MNIRRNVRIVGFLFFVFHKSLHFRQDIAKTVLMRERSGKPLTLQKKFGRPLSPRAHVENSRKFDTLDSISTFEKLLIDRLAMVSGMRFFLFIVCLIAGCSTSPSGRKQIQLISETQMWRLGEDAFSKMKGEKNLSLDPTENILVLCVTQRILNAIGQLPTQWEAVVFSDETPNAFAIPGNNIGVNSGMLSLIQNQSQLAAVIGHEIGHVLAKHGNERMSQLLLTRYGLRAAEIILGQDTGKDRLILAALGLGAQIGILLPFSRTQETEADRLGVEYMAKAGFDPSAAIGLWNLMEKKSSRTPLEFLSTHPSYSTRIRDLGELMPHFSSIYESIPDKPDCGSTKTRGPTPTNAANPLFHGGQRPGAREQRI